MTELRSCPYNSRLSGFGDDVVPSDDVERFYHRHVSDMTKYELHSKADIAWELAYRDAEIERLKLIEWRMEQLEK